MTTIDLPIVFEGYQVVSPSKNKEEAAKRFTRYVANGIFGQDTVFSWIGFVDGEPAGCIILTVMQHPYEVPELQAMVDLVYVKKKYRQHKLAIELVGVVLDFLKENNIPEVYGIHDPKNDKVWDQMAQHYPGIKKVGSLYMKEVE